MNDEAKPFPPLRQFRRRGEFVSYLLKAFPDAPEWFFIEAAGDPVIYLREVAALRG
jgi:hypothetical protein